MLARPPVMLLGVLLLAVAAAAGARSAPRLLEQVPLQWKPPSSLKLDRDSMRIPDATVQIETFQDARPNRQAIGENQEESTPKPVTTTDDVGAFVSAHLHEVLATAGVKIVDSGAMVTISGRVTQFFVKETSRYNALVTVQLTVSGRDRPLWSGAVSGEASHFGRSYKLDNYYEGLSDATMNVAGAMLQNAALVRALSAPAPVRHPDPLPPLAQRSSASSAGVTDGRRGGGTHASTPPSRTAEAPARGPAPSDVSPGVWVPERRLALVIGNSAYTSPGSPGPVTWPDLQGGPVKDAEAVAARLEQLHFEVTRVLDADYEQLNTSLEKFGGRITPNSLAVFYFAGYGVQAPLGVARGGEDNYLIPVRTTLTREGDAHFKALALSEVRDVLHRGRAGIVILDASRANTLQRSGSRAATVRGLRAAEAVPGMLFAYAAAPGEVTQNRSGQTSRYTQALVDELNKPGELLTSVFRTVRRQSGPGNRMPELTDRLKEDILLQPQGGAP